MEKINIDTFKEKIMQNKKPVILEFHGSMCTACVNVEMELNEAEAHYGERIFFAMVDADNEPLINTALHVYELPALFFFKAGHLLYRHNGFITADALNAEIKQMLNE